MNKKKKTLSKKHPPSKTIKPDSQFSLNQNQLDEQNAMNEYGQKHQVEDQFLFQQQLQIDKFRTPVQSTAVLSPTHNINLLSCTKSDSSKMNVTPDTKSKNTIRQTLGKYEESKVPAKKQTNTNKRHSKLNPIFTRPKKGNKHHKRKKRRKTIQQLKVLREAFSKDQSMWSKEKIKSLAQQTNLTKQEVYKWQWEQKRQRFNKAILNEQEQQSSQIMPQVDEFGGYAKIGHALPKQNKSQQSDDEDVVDIDQFLIGSSIKNPNAGGQGKSISLAEALNIDLDGKLKTILQTVTTNKQNKIDLYLGEITPVHSSSLDQYDISSRTPESSSDLNSSQIRKESNSGQALNCQEEIFPQPLDKNLDLIRNDYENKMKDYKYTINQ